ncbi:MAG: flavin reductase [Rhodospirillaceae bacterium]|nr:flavin reductase [Rhodospirillaceae bacterium]
MTHRPGSAMKVEAKIRPFWYSDVWLFPKLITVITTLDAQGRVNAAPYSHIMQYDVMAKRPRMMVGFRQDSHTFENICATGEFVVNCPPADYVADVMETARFYPEGVNELDHTRFTAIPSKKVKPPSLQECPQIAECTVDEIVRLEKSSGIVIANIVALVFDQGLAEMDRAERIKTMNLPIGLGDEDRRDYFFATTDNMTRHTLKETPQGYAGAALKVELPWDEDAMHELMKVPPFVRNMVMRQVERHAGKQNAARVTARHMADAAAESGMDEAMMERFRGKGR